MEEFISYLSHELNRSPHTVEAYIRDLSQFQSWLTGKTNSAFDPGSVTISDIRAWIGTLAKTDSSATLRRKTQSLRAYFRWLLKQGRIAANPAADVTLAKKGKHLPEFVRETEMEHLLSSPPASGKAEASSPSARNRRRLSILYSTGIRHAALLG